MRTTKTTVSTAYRWLYWCAILAGFTGALHSQESRGTITGRVTDTTDAVVAGVKVTAKNVSTNVVIEAMTNSTGSYLLPYLTPGSYDITAELAGFSPASQRVAVQVADRLAVNLKLNPVGVSTSVEVAGEGTPLLSTESASNGTIMDQRQISDLPLPFGNPFMLASLSPGVVFTAANMLQIRPYDNGVVSNIRVDGAPGGNAFTLDGAPNEADSRGLQKGMNVSYVPPAEAVQEFKMETSSFDARLGHAPGAAVNVVMKSGTNDLHGAAWEFTRFHNLVANDFYLRRAHLTPPTLSMHRYGATIGGPAFVPKVYNGRNRTFFFFAFEKMDTYQPLGSSQTVPTEAQKAGDFSGLLAQKIVTYNPFSATAASGGRIQRTPFPNNQIPASLLSPIAQNLMKYYPAPNAAGDSQGSNNYVANDTQTDLFDSEMIRVDHTFSQKHRSFARLLHNYRDSPSTGWAGGETYNGVNPSLGLGFRGNVGIFFDHVYVPSSSDVIDVRAGITRYTVGNKLKAEGFDLASLGFPASTLTVFNGARYFPTFSPSGVASLSGGGGDFTASNTFYIQPTYTKATGKHVINAGYDVRAYRLNAMPAMSDAGPYSFGTNYTKGPLDNSTAAAGPAQGLASMLLGLPTSGSITRGASSAIQSFYQGLFVQDDFKVTPRLTLSLGLRYEIELPTTERFNRTARGFDFTTPSPIQSEAQKAYAAKPDPALAPADFHILGGLLFADSSHRGIWDSKANLVQPRIGASFQITPKTVLRGGWGLYMIPFGPDGLFQPGFSQTTNLVPTLDNGLTFVANLANPFPNGVLAPAGASAGLSTYLGQGVSFTPLQRQTGTTQRFQIGLQRELPGRWVVEVSYTETRGNDLAISTSLDAIPAKYLSTSPIRDTNAINFLTASIDNPMAGLLGSTSLSGTKVARSQILLPFPQFSSVGADRYDGATRYRGVEIRANHRFRSGFTLTTSYSRSRLREQLSMLNAIDAQPEDRVSGEDRPNHFSANGIYELPFGKGRKIGSGWNRLTDGFLGGWQLGGVYVIQSGRPMTLGNVYFTGDPNKLVAKYHKSNPSYPTFDTSGFYFHDTAVQTNGVDDPVKQRADPRIQLSNNIRTLGTIYPNFRGDHINQLDASLVKNLKIRERLGVQVRAELINVFNQVQFNTPSLTPTSATFAQITASSQLSRPRTAQFGIRITY